MNFRYFKKHSGVILFIVLSFIIAVNLFLAYQYVNEGFEDNQNNTNTINGDELVENIKAKIEKFDNIITDLKDLQDSI